MTNVRKMASREQEPETFGTVLRRCRQAKRLTQREVARAMGMELSDFSRLERDRGTSLPTHDTIATMAEAMGCTETETLELLAAAGRVTVDMQERPARRRLSPTAAPLPEAVLEEVITAAEEQLKRRG